MLCLILPGQPAAGRSVDPKNRGRDLGTLPGGSYSRAHDLNDSDEVAGVAASPAGDRAVLWTKSGDARDLGICRVI